MQIALNVRYGDDPDAAVDFLTDLDGQLIRAHVGPNGLDVARERMLHTNIVVYALAALDPGIEGGESLMQDALVDLVRIVLRLGQRIDGVHVEMDHPEFQGYLGVELE